MEQASTLIRLRGEIDHIDNQLLNLIERRLGLCADVHEAKTDESLLLRPCREKKVVERLKARASGVPGDCISHIWRELMGHSLQLQGPVEFLLLGGNDNHRQLLLVREHFGSAAPVKWLPSASEALDIASTGQAVAVLPYGANLKIPDSLTRFELLRDENGDPALWAIGRIAEVPDEEERSAGIKGWWRPDSWRARPAEQLPDYLDKAALKAVEKRIAQRAPLVELNDVDALSLKLSDALQGQAILLQVGDCAERFDENSKEKSCEVGGLIAAMATAIECTSELPVIRVGRLAGQYAKPRTRLSETVGGEEIPAYRGDAVNGFWPDPQGRAPDPARLLAAYDHSARTADWLCQQDPDGSERLFVSHEALLLPYEQALTHYDDFRARWWAGSGHLLWVGNRTREPEGAHIEYVRGIANPIGVKVGPETTTDELLRLLDRLGSVAEQRRLTLIARLGRDRLRATLPGLMRAQVQDGRPVLWCVDPMHGNTRIVGGIKTRAMQDIEAELRSFFEIAEAEGVWPGGVHLEGTPEAVTECLGGKSGIREKDLRLRYRSACDPRLNRDQALEIAELIASLYGKLLRKGA